MTSRRAGQTGQIDFQGRSHLEADCGSYRLLERTAPSTWRVEWIAPCDLGDRYDLMPGEAPTSTLRFVSREQYDRHF